MGDRPVTYKDWRRLWHAEGKWLGWKIVWRVRKYGYIKMDRDLWKHIDRLRRIEDRLHLESEVMDSSWCEAVMEVIFGRGE